MGAGPTGLMAACRLAKLGVNFQIVDKNSGPVNESRALVIQARTLEIFEQMGVVEEFIREGNISHAFNFFVEGKKALRVPITAIGEHVTRYPYFLILEQFKTERILTDFLKKLGHEVHRDTELKTMHQGKQLVTAQVVDQHGKKEIQAKWLIGADGASSPVRSFLKIPFVGKTYQKYFFVLDCKTDWKGRNDELYGAFGPNDFGLFLHLKGKDQVRVIGILPSRLQDKEDISFDDVYPELIERLKLDIKLHSPKWISAYHAHHRCVGNFRQNRCFLAGDAAHIHSPIGAQGMNTGLQDAYNLAWKLALVIQGRAKESILDTYNEERIKFAHKLVHTTDRLFNFVISDRLLVQFFRLHIFPRLMAFLFRLPFTQKKLFNLVSEIGINYRESAMTVPSSLGPLQSGDRLPHIDIGDKWTDDYLVGDGFHLFHFGDKLQTDLVRAVLREWSDLLDVHQIKSGKLKRALGVSGSGYCLVRPDRHIALVSEAMNVELLKEYFTTYFSPE